MRKYFPSRHPIIQGPFQWWYYTTRTFTSNKHSPTSFLPNCPHNTQGDKLSNYWNSITESPLLTLQHLNYSLENQEKYLKQYTHKILDINSHLTFQQAFSYFFLAKFSTTPKRTTFQIIEILWRQKLPC